MEDNYENELITDAINNLTGKISRILLEEFLQLAQELQLNVVLIKSAQLLLANVLCQVAANQDELDQIINDQGAEIKELAINCSFTGFADKFNRNKH